MKPNLIEIEGLLVAADVDPMMGKPSLILERADGSSVILLGLTDAECNAVAQVHMDGVTLRLAKLEPATRPGWRDINDIIADREKDPSKAAALDRARQRLASKTSPDEFTDTARAALLWVLWHHQGGSSPVGQPIRLALGMDAHERLSERQVQEAKRWAALTNSETRNFHRGHAEQPVNAQLLAALKEAREALQFANDSPGGPITDTIWMVHQPETLFDFLDSAISAAEAQQAGPARLTDEEIKSVLGLSSASGLAARIARLTEDAVLERNGLNPQAKGDGK